MKNFNIFRLNCLLNNRESNNFNEIIISVVYGLLYENNNKETLLSECYNYIISNLKISIDNDILRKLVENSKHLEISPLSDDLLIKLTPDKYKLINESLLSQSIEHYLSEFIQRKGLPEIYNEKLFKLLSKAIYENINSFTIKNINSLITNNLSNGFTNTEIELFNEFLVEKNHLKNVALYNTFVKAIEFALITSGKGVREFTKDIFNGKEYYLDANIIFRLLGIGGEERQKSVSSLVKQCVHQGINFYYSIATYKEFKRKIDSSIREIKNANSKNALRILENIATDESYDSHFNDGFFTLYSRLRKRGHIKSPEQFENWLYTEFKLIEKKYSIKSRNCESELKESQISHWSKKLLELKESLNKNIHYTKTAARVDSINILFVKKIRGNNDYNYSDVKSFYLTTDRTLNQIIAIDTNLIPETILPSQLFIIHNSLSDETDNVDYDTFTLFLKRRTTDFKLSGEEILRYIDEIRQYSTEEEIIQEVIKAYSDLKYSKANEESNGQEMPTIKEFAKTYIDHRLFAAEIGDQKYKDIVLKALNRLKEFIDSSRNLARLLDMIVTLLGIPLLGVLVKTLFSSNYTTLTITIVALELIKFLFSSKFDLPYKIMKDIYLFKVRRSPYLQILESGNVFYTKAIELIEMQNKNIWKK